MKTAFLMTIALITGLSAKPQAAIDKINNGLYKAENINNTVNKFKGLLGKKNKKEKATDTASTAALHAATASEKKDIASVANEKKNETKTTVISITGIDYARLKTLNDNVRACMGVDKSNMKLGSPASIIEISHTGTTEALFKFLSEASKDIFTEKNIVAFEEGKVTLKI